MKSINILFALLLSSGFYAQEQQIIVVEQGDGRYRSPRKSSEVKVVDNSWAIKYSPTQILAGEINLSLELKVEERTSLEFEIGPTISNIGEMRFTNLIDPTYVESNSGIGMLLSAAVRYYPMDEYKVMNRFYVSPKLRYRSYNTIYESMTYDLNDQRGTMNQFGFIFNVGVQTWLSQSFAVDYFIGMGIGYKNERTYTVSETYDGNTNTFNANWVSDYKSGANYIVHMGIKLGIGN